MNIYSYFVKEKTGHKQRVITACRILSNAARFQIVNALMTAKRSGEELCVGDIASAIGASQSATSHQLALLEAHGVVNKKRIGQTVCYDLAPAAITKDIEHIIHSLKKSV